jgi:hypothetical protein
LFLELLPELGFGDPNYTVFSARLNGRKVPAGNIAAAGANADA